MKGKFSLDRVFDPERLLKIWRAHVWPALRDQSCEDIIEYYDYNVAIVENIRKLSARVRRGNFTTSQPLQLELSKADKLVRRTQIPTPEDALVLQAIAESIFPIAEVNAPSCKAYFSRSHTTPKGIHTMDNSQLYPWFKLWPKYQTNILEFAKSRKYLVITDIQNFFDSVPHPAIDRSLSAIGIGQTLRDITLFTLQGFVHRDMYGPLVLKGHSRN